MSATERPETAARATERQVRLAWFAALAVAIHTVEALIPSPLPGVKLGLANAVTLVVLLLHGPRDALTVTLTRIVVGALLIGTFPGPGFLLSLSGGVAAWAAMALARPLWPRLLGPLGLSVLGAAAHILAQVGVVFVLLVRHAGLLHLAPLLLLSAAATGVATGLVAARLVAVMEAAGLGGGAEG